MRSCAFTINALLYYCHTPTTSLQTFDSSGPRTHALTPLFLLARFPPAMGVRIYTPMADLLWRRRQRKEPKEVEYNVCPLSS